MPRYNSPEMLHDFILAPHALAIAPPPDLTVGDVIELRLLLSFLRGCPANASQHSHTLLQ